MNAEDLKRKWDQLGERDPLWAILTDDSKKGGRWNLDEFFASGRSDAQNFVSLAAFLNDSLERGDALDFGCGVGRLSQGFAPYFKSVTGVDISGSMIEQANRLNTFGTSVRYIENPHSDLRLLSDESFDFVLSHIVLQHIPTPMHRAYIAEFVRVLRPRGIGIFQLPEPFPEEWGSVQLTEANVEKIDMYGSPQEVVLQILQDAGARILQVRPDQSCGEVFPGFRYAFSKQ